MDTIIKKKGKSAIAIVLSLALVLTTVTFPVSVAKAVVDEPQVMPVVVDLGDDILPPSKELQHFNLTEGYNFVYIKQANGDNVLWTVDNFESIWGPTIDIGTKEARGSEWTLFYNFLGSQLKPNADLKGPTIQYIHGFVNSPFFFKLGQPNQYKYEFTMDPDDGHISFIYIGDKVSHFYEGKCIVPANNVPLVFTKVLENMDLDSGMFDFRLSEASIPDLNTDTWVIGNELQRVSNTDSTNNNVVFKDLLFTRAGTYLYIIDELSDNPITNVEYDNHRVYLTVTVEEVATGVFNAVAEFSGESGESVDKVFTNTYEEEEALGTITWTKVDATNGDKLAGSKWTLTKLGEIPTIMKVVDNGINDADEDIGELKVVGLELGDYTLQESKAPKGYRLNKTIFERTISADTRSIEIGEVKDTRRAGILTWTKNDATGGALLAGSEWTLTKPNGKTITVVDNVGSEDYKGLDKDKTPGEFKVTGLRWGDYTVKELKAPEGYTLNDSTYYATFGFLGNGTFVGSYDLGAIENTKETGSIPVTKTVEIPDGATFKTPYTFYVALFDEEGVMYEGEGYGPLELVVNPIAPDTELKASGTFTGLDLTRVYDVYEVYKVGDAFVKISTDPITNKVTAPENVPWKEIEYANNENISVFGDNNTAATVTVNNVYGSEEGAYDPAIEVTKKVTHDGKTDLAAPENALTFYVGLFSNKDLTTRIIYKPFTTTTKAIFDKDSDGKPLGIGVIYYIAETDEFGNPIVGTASKLGYQISINSVSNNNAEVVLVEEGTAVTITNDYITKKTEEFPLTGDDSNMGLWLFLAMLGVAGAIAPFAFRKKEVAND